MGIPRYTQIPFMNPGTYPSDPNPDGYPSGLPLRYVSGYPMPDTDDALSNNPESDLYLLMHTYRVTMFSQFMATNLTGTVLTFPLA
jgi:hypothetical protein